MNEKEQKTSYVENMMMAQNKKKDSDSMSGILQSINLLATIMNTSVKTYIRVGDKLDDLNKNIAQEREETKKLVRSVSSVGVGSSSATKKDHSKQKEDPVVKEVKNISALLREEIDLRKEQFAKKGGGILASLAGLLTVGGLMGFLVTGKQEFLFSVVKGLKHAGSLMMHFFTMPLKLASASKDLIEVMTKGSKAADQIGKSGKMFLGIKYFLSNLKSISTMGGAWARYGKDIKKIGSLIKSGYKLAVGGMASITKFVSSSMKSIGPALKSLMSFGKGGFDIGKYIKPVVSFAKNIKSMIKGGMDIGKIFGSIGKLAKSGIGAAKVAGAGIKAFAKTGGKTALKKIPVIGGLLGLFFGWQRFAKGDVVGGVLEVASGLTSMIPGIGIPLGLAIDGFLLMNDMKGGSMTKKTNEGIKKFGKEQIKNVPGIGTILRVVDAVKFWKEGKKKEALIEILKAGIISTGIGGILMPFIEKFIDKGADLASMKAKEAGGAIKKLDLQSMKNLPIIGTVVRMQEAMKLWNSGNKAAALKEFASSGLVNIPGVSLLMSGIDHLLGLDNTNATSSNGIAAPKSQQPSKISPSDGAKTQIKSIVAKTEFKRAKSGSAVPVADSKKIAPAPVIVDTSPKMTRLSKEDLDYLANMMGTKYKENQPKTSVIQAGGRTVSARK